jgi:hypothetical protein
MVLSISFELVSTTLSKMSLKCVAHVVLQMWGLARHLLDQWNAQVVQNGRSNVMVGKKCILINEIRDTHTHTHRYKLVWSKQCCKWLPSTRWQIWLPCYLDVLMLYSELDVMWTCYTIRACVWVASSHRNAPWPRTAFHTPRRLPADIIGRTLAQLTSRNTNLMCHIHASSACSPCNGAPPRQLWTIYNSHKLTLRCCC